MSDVDFVVPGDNPDFKLLSILRITCDIRGEPHESRKFNSQTVEASNSPSCRTNRTLWNETRIIIIETCQIISSPAQRKQHITVSKVSIYLKSDCHSDFKKKQDFAAGCKI